MRKKRGSFGKKKQKLKKSIFIGRQDQINSFKVNLKNGPDHDDFSNIINIHGQGGVGKTTLLNQFLKVASDLKYKSVLIDMEDVDLYLITSVMARIARELEEIDFNFKKFNQKYKDYLQHKSTFESDQHRPNSILESVTSDGVKIGMHTAAEFIPGGGLIKEFVPIDTIAESSGKLVDYAWRKLGNSEDVDLVINPIKILTPIWLEELYDCYNKQNLIINFDTYETANPIIDKWFSEIFEGEYGDVPDNILILFSGRKKLDNSYWKELSDFTITIPLKPFNKEETKAYLESKNIDDEKTIEDIYSISSGLPVYLSLLVDEYSSEGTYTHNPTEKVVSRFLRYIQDPIQKKLARFAALPRKLNVDICTRLIEDEEQSINLFEWLKSRPFVQNRGGNWVYHPVVKQQMITLIKSESQESYEDAHLRLSQYYIDRSKRISVDDEDKDLLDKEWRAYRLESWYHRLSANPKIELPKFINFMVRFLSMNTELEDGLSFRDVLMQIENDEACSFWSNLLDQGMTNYIDKKNDYGLEMCTKIIDSGFLDDDSLLAYLHNFSGICYHHMGKDHVDQQIDCYLKAIELHPNYIQATRNLGLTYKEQDKENLAIKWMNKALELEPNNLRTLELQGNTYFKFHQYENAIECYKALTGLSESHNEAYYNIGQCYRNLEDYDNAIAFFTKQIEKSSGHLNSYIALGNMYTDKFKDFESAEKIYKQGIVDFPKSLYFPNQLSNLYRLHIQDKAEALKYAKQAQELDPNNYYGYFMEGMLYAHLDINYKKAVKLFEKALSLNSEDEFSSFQLGYTSYYTYDYQRVIDLFEPLQTSSNLNQRLLFWSTLSKAYIKSSQADTPQFEHAVNKAIETSPKNEAYGWHEIGHIYHQFPKYDLAKEYYEKALELDPNYLESLLNLGIIDIESNDNVENGIKKLEGLLDENKSEKTKQRKYSNMIFSSLAVGYYKTGQQDLALEKVSQVLSSDPNNLNAIILKADIIRMGLNDYKNAIPLYKKVLELDKSNYSALLKLGICYSEDVETLDLALSLLSKANDINPNEEALLQTGAILYNHKKKYDEAKEAYLKVLEKDNKNVLALSNLGVYYYEHKNQKKKGLEYWDKILAIKPDNLFTLKKVAWKYLLDHQIDKAKRCFEGIINQDKNPSYHNWMNLGHCYYINKDTQAAIENYKLAIEKCNDLEEFLKGMMDDYHDIKMEELGLPLKEYEELVDQLRN